MMQQGQEMKRSKSAFFSWRWTHGLRQPAKIFLNDPYFWPWVKKLGNRLSFPHKILTNAHISPSSLFHRQNVYYYKSLIYSCQHNLRWISIHHSPFISSITHIVNHWHIIISSSKFPKNNHPSKDILMIFIPCKSICL